MLQKVLPIAMAAALAALIVGGVSAADSGDRSAPRDFTVVSISASQTFVDSNPTGDVGDEFVFTDVLKNRAGKTIGSDAGVCTVTEFVSDQVGSAHCVVNGTLPGGTIEAAGMTHFAPGTSRFAITGGTGRYDSARGQVTSRDVTDTKTVLRFDID